MEFVWFMIVLRGWVYIEFSRRDFCRGELLIDNLLFRMFLFLYFKVVEVVIGRFLWVNIFLIVLM